MNEINEKATRKTRVAIISQHYDCGNSCFSKAKKLMLFWFWILNSESLNCNLLHLLLVNRSV